MKLEFLNAAHGDAILASWGDPRRLALIDGGLYRVRLISHFYNHIEQLRAERKPGLDDPLFALKLVCVSHIDDDHIAGMVRILTDLRRKKREGLPLPYRVERLWHNSFEEIIATASKVVVGVAGQNDLDMRTKPYSSVVAASV